MEASLRGKTGHVQKGDAQVVAQGQQERQPLESPHTAGLQANLQKSLSAGCHTPGRGRIRPGPGMEKSVSEGISWSWS